MEANGRAKTLDYTSEESFKQKATFDAESGETESLRKQREELRLHIVPTSFHFIQR